MQPDNDGNLDPRDRVWLDQSVLYSLLQPKPGPLFVFQDSDVEGESTSLLLHLRDDGTRRLHLELVGNRRVLLVDGCSGFFQSSLLEFEIRERVGGIEEIELSYLAILSRAHEDVNPPNFTLGEGNCLELSFLGLRRVQNDPLLPIDYILFLVA